MEHTNRVFIAKKRLLYDFLLVLNAFLFLLHSFAGLSFQMWGILATAINGIAILLWFVAVVPLTKVELHNNSLVGRTPSLSKVSFPLRKVHHIKTTSPLKGWKRKFFKDVWSTEGKCLRLQRKFLGETQVNEIILTIEKYPFRESPIAITPAE